LGDKMETKCALWLFGLVAVLLFAGSGQGATFTTVTKADFDEGTYMNDQTKYDQDHVQLESTFDDGYYRSKVFDAGAVVAWDLLSWTPGLAYWTELSSDADTLMLCHFNDTTDCETGNMLGKDEVGTTYGDGKFNTNGTKILAGDNLVYNVTSNINLTEGTVEFWFKANSDFWEDGSDDFLFVVYVDANNRIRIFNRDANDLRFQYGAGGVDKSVTRDESDAWGTEWHHLAMTWSKTADEFKAYIDGVQTIPTRNGLGVWAGTPTGIFIGSNQNKGKLAKGIYEELRISDRARNASEILESYKRGVLKLKAFARTCDDAVCDVEGWTNLNDSTPQELALPDNRFFQYRFRLQTEDIINAPTPELYNVTVDYTPYPIEVVNRHKQHFSIAINGSCVGKNMTVSLKNGSKKPVKNAEIKVYVYNGYAKKLTNLKTDNLGMASFVPPQAGTYKLFFMRGGYYNDRRMVTVGSCTQ